MDRRGFLHSAAASLALAQSTSTVRTALIIEPSGGPIGAPIESNTLFEIQAKATQQVSNQRGETRPRTFGPQFDEKQSGTLKKHVATAVRGNLSVAIATLLG